MTDVLTVRDLKVKFGAVEAVRGMSMRIAESETMILLGESGSGKSATARAILRLHGKVAEVAGSVRVRDSEVATLGPRELRDLRGSSVGFVPQDPVGAFDPLRRIDSQFREVLRVHGKCRSRKEANSRSMDLLATVGIPDPVRVGASRPHELSGGMLQRAAIALAVSCSPDLLIADEPTSALDVTMQAGILQLFLDLQRRLSTSLLLVTHDVGVAEEMGGRIGVMYAGRMVESGPTDSVLRDPQHPYTHGLLDSLPAPGIPRGELRAIPGRPPLTGESGSGCGFASRCSIAESTCHVVEPPMAYVGRDHLAACPVAARKSAMRPKGTE